MTDTDIEHISLLYGGTCPVCDGPIERGSLRFNGSGWTHINPDDHPQAGHHVFDPQEVTYDD